MYCACQGCISDDSQSVALQAALILILKESHYDFFSSGQLYNTLYPLCMYIENPKGPFINDFTPEGSQVDAKMVIWGDFQGINGVTRGGRGV